MQDNPLHAKTMWTAEWIMQDVNPTATCCLAFKEPLENCCYEAPGSEWPCIANVHISNNAFNVWTKCNIDSKSMHLAATESIMCSNCGAGGGGLRRWRWQADVVAEEQLYSAHPAQSGGLFRGKIGVIIFQSGKRQQRGVFGRQICQNGNGSSS